MSEEIALAAADRETTIRQAARIAELESQLGSAYEEIARLESALRQVVRMKTIKGARAIVVDALGKEGR